MERAVVKGRRRRTKKEIEEEREKKRKEDSKLGQKMEQWLGGNKADKGTEIRGINPKLVKTENDVRKMGTQTPIIFSRSMIVSGSVYEEKKGKEVRNEGVRVKELMGKFQKVERVEVKKVKDV